MKEERDGYIEEEPFRSCHGLRIAVTCHSQIRPSPKHVRLGLLLFIYPAFPSIPLLPSRSPPLSFLVLCASILLPPLLRPPFFSSRVRSGIDRCHGGTNTPGRTCQRVLISSVIVINTLIRTVAMSDTFVAACAILNIMRVT